MNEFNAERWSQLWRQVSPAEPPEFAPLAARYAEPQRHYHDAQHIANCLAQFDQVRRLAAQSVAVELAIWFHDAVYDPHAPDNEERSVQLAVATLRKAGADKSLSHDVEQLVLATKLHDTTNHPDAPLLVDVDLSILGQPPERFWTYEQQIRQEYAWVETTVFAAKRAEILHRFLARPRIYQTDYFYARLETQARENLRASIEQLTSVNG